MHKQETLKNFQHLARQILAVYSFLLCVIFTILFNLDINFMFYHFMYLMLSIALK